MDDLSARIGHLLIDLPHMPTGTDLKEAVDGPEAWAAIEALQSMQDTYLSFHDLELDLAEEYGIRNLSVRYIVGTPDYESMLSLHVMNHDLVPVFSGYLQGRNSVEAARTILAEHGEQAVRGFMRASNILESYDALRYGLAFIGHLASGDPYSFSVPSSRLGDIIDRFTSDITAAYDLDGITHISPGELFASYQLIKNAHQNMRMHHAGGLIEASFTDMPAGERCIEIRDFGSGINPDMLPYLLNVDKALALQQEFPSMGRKSGLALVGLFLKRCDGYAEISTSQEGTATFYVDTSIGLVAETDELMEKGTAFRLYLPMSSINSR